jgi:hypothetical protein
MASLTIHGHHNTAGTEHGKPPPFAYLIVTPKVTLSHKKVKNKAIPVTGRGGL